MTQALTPEDVAWLEKRMEEYTNDRGLLAAVVADPKFRSLLWRFVEETRLDATADPELVAKAAKVRRVILSLPTPALPDERVN